MKKIVYAIILIALIVGGIYTAKQISESEEVRPTVGNTVESTSKVENKVEENKVVETEKNTVDNNEVEKEVTTQTPEEQAKQIVRDNWGEDDTIYLSYDGKDENGKYIICVREKSSTKALYWYYVDIETGTFDIE